MCGVPASHWSGATTSFWLCCHCLPGTNTEHDMESDIDATTHSICM
jgi:hypothetical protein